MSELTAEDMARAILMRMDVAGAEKMTSGDVVEIANLIARAERAEAERDTLRAALGKAARAAEALSWSHRMHGPCRHNGCKECLGASAAWKEAKSDPTVAAALEGK